MKKSARKAKVEKQKKFVIYIIVTAALVTLLAFALLRQPPPANPCETGCSWFNHAGGGVCHCHGRCGTEGCMCHGADAHDNMRVGEAESEIVIP